MLTLCFDAVNITFLDIMWCFQYTLFQTDHILQTLWWEIWSD